MKNTMIELVTELEKLSDTPLRETMIKNAKIGSFHDYRAPSACGKMYFVKCSKWFKDNIGKANNKPADDIQKMNVMESDIKDGVYDETYTEEDSKIVLADLENNSTISETDKKFFRKAMSWNNGSMQL